MSTAAAAAAAVLVDAVDALLLPHRLFFFHSRALTHEDVCITRLITIIISHNVLSEMHHTHSNARTREYEHRYYDVQTTLLTTRGAAS